MLQVNDGFLIFPVGLNDHALDGTTDHAEGTGLFLDNAETLLSLQATALPFIVAQVDRLAEQQKKEALNAFRAAAQRLRALGLSAEALASLLTQEEPTDD